MLSPTYLSETDRTRLAEINQNLLGAHTTEEGLEMRKEQQELMGKRRTIQECTLTELNELRQQLYSQHQKHASIGSGQLKLIQSYIQQVEYRVMLIEMKRVDEPEESEDAKKAKSRPKVSSNEGSYSWTVGSSSDDDI